MKTLPILFVVLFQSILLFAQQPQYAYEVHFNNKNQTTFTLDNPQAYLSSKAIERRAKYSIDIDSLDLPVNEQYIDSVLYATSGILHCTSRWLNQIVILVNDTTNMATLNNYNFISNYKRVGYFATGLHNKPALEEKPLDDFDTNYYAAAWNQIHMCHGESLHQQGYRGEGILIAVLDVGFENVNTIPFFDSLMIQNRVVDKYNFVQHTDDVYQSGNHGTAILSCLATVTPNQFVGTAPYAQYALYATEDNSSEKFIELDNWVAAAERADSIGTDIISSSLGYNNFDDTANSLSYSMLDGKTTIVAKAANIATQKGILVIIAAGNEGNTDWHNITTPGDADSALTIGAVDSAKEAASFSSYGPNAAGHIKPDVSAQGVATAFINSSGMLNTASGTSLATPIISGLAACLLQANPNKTPFEIRNIIQSVSDHYPNPNNHIGYGVPNFEQALANTNVNNIDNNTSISIYPNPISDKLVIGINDANSNTHHQVQVDIYDITGKIVFSNVYLPHTKSILLPTSKLQNGVYFIKLVCNQRTFFQKIVKANY